MKALIIVDVQNDFLENGSLAVPNGNEVISIINELQSDYDLIVATQDWHPDNHQSFVTEHPDHRTFDLIDLHGLRQVLWPKHCVQGSFGAELHDELVTDQISAIFRKGMDMEVDSYSGFFDNGKRNHTGLFGYLVDKQVTDVDVVGLAADYCVYFTAKDALHLGFRTSIIEKATKAIDTQNWENCKLDLIDKGGFIK